MPTLPGGMELVVIAILIVVLFGWKKLPDAARSLGRSMRIFKAEVEEMKDKPSAASRDTVSGEARRGETYRAGEARDRHDDRSREDRYDDRPRDDRYEDRYDERGRDDHREHRYDDRPRDEHRESVRDDAPREQDPQYRPPMA